MIELHRNSILCAFDAHRRADESIEEVDRFHALGQAIQENKPSAFVLGGDIIDFPSLAEYNGARSVGGSGSNRAHIGKTVNDDLDAFEETLAIIDAATEAANCRHYLAGNPQEAWEPEKIFICGNHELRIEKIPQHQPELDRLIGIHMIREIVEARGYLFVPFLENYNLWGVNFRHYFKSGLRGNAVGIKQALNLLSESVIWGHSHEFGFDTRITASGRRINAVCCPTFKSVARLEEKEESGVIWLNDVRNGDFELARTSTHSLLRKYHQNNKSLQRAA